MNLREAPHGLDHFDLFVEKYEGMLITISTQTKKNYWSRICSAKDWITVVVDHLESTDAVADCLMKADMHAYTLISCIEIISQIAKMLHQTFIDDSTVPFSGDTKIFGKNDLFRDDNRYFANLRACFGAHPIKLDLDNKDRPIRYASWPTTHHIDEYDVSVRLYSENMDEEDITLGFKASQLVEFLNTRYGYLEEIENAILDMIDNHTRSHAAKQIEVSDNPLRQIEILKEENHNRLGNDHYHYTLESIQLFLQTDFTSKANNKQIEAFLARVQDGITEIYMELSNMRLSELKVYKILHPDFLPIKGFSYNFAKLSDEVYNPRGHNLFNASMIIDALSQHVTFEYRTVNELYWLAIIGINLANGNIVLS